MANAQPSGPITKAKAEHILRQHLYIGGPRRRLHRLNATFSFRSSKLLAQLDIRLDTIVSKQASLEFLMPGNEPKSPTIVSSGNASLGSAAAHQPPTRRTAFDHVFTGIDGAALPLSDFRGQVLLIVNTASRCGFSSHLKDLESLWQRYRSQGLVVIGVPSNDFGWQEPNDASQIAKFYAENHGVTFLLTEKASVRGTTAHPFYIWARQSHGLRHVPHWNFHKYVVSRDGQIAKAFAATTRPHSSRLTALLDSCLQKPQP